MPTYEILRPHWFARSCRRCLRSAQKFTVIPHDATKNAPFQLSNFNLSKLRFFRIAVQCNNRWQMKKSSTDGFVIWNWNSFKVPYLSRRQIWKCNGHLLLIWIYLSKSRMKSSFLFKRNFHMIISLKNQTNQNLIIKNNFMILKFKIPEKWYIHMSGEPEFFSHGPLINFLKPLQD